jgi:RNA polymerase sigma factor (sigma-70 family)
MMQGIRLRLGIMVNTALDYYRKHQKHQHQENIEGAFEISSDDVNPISKLSYEELLGLVQKLPPSYRMVFSLFAIDGYSHDEISKKLGISEGTSKSNLSRARDGLKAMLAKIS